MPGFAWGRKRASVQPSEDALPIYICLALWVLVGVSAAAMLYPWRRPAVRPYLDVVLLLVSPLMVMVFLQAAFGLPPGSCVERPLNNAPLLLIGVGLATSVALPFIFREVRRFAIALAVGLLPLTVGWGLIATMSLAGCWI